MDQEKNRRDDLEDTAFFSDEEDFAEAGDEAQEMPSPRGRQEDPIEYVHQLINELLDTVSTAKKGLFSQNVLVEREVMIDNLQRVWEQLPEAVAEAEQVLRERDRILQEAREHAGNVTREADINAQKKIVEAENMANRTIQEANGYYSEHKQEADAYLSQRQQEGDAFLRDRQAEADNYARQTVQNAEVKANSILENAERQRNQMIAQENVVRAAEAAAQALKNQAEAEYSARVTKAEEDANTLYGSAYGQTQKLLRELSEFQKKQNQELRLYCEELEKRHEQPARQA